MAKKDTSKQQQYTASDIQVLEGLAAVRKRPGMYIGDTGINGLHHMIWEILDNAVDEAIAGFCSEIRVEIDDQNWVTITDNGRGLPVDPHPKTGEPAFYLIFENLHAGGKFGGEQSAYKVAGGLHGVGAKVVCALSRRLEVKTWRDGRGFSAAWERGVRVQDMRPLAKVPAGSGTSVRFLYDDEIFRGVKYQYNLIGRRIEEKSYLVPNVAFRYSAPGHPAKTWRSTKGLAELVAKKARALGASFAEPLGTRETIKIQHDGAEKEILVEFACSWTKSSSEIIDSFANAIPTPEEGPHVSGLKAALTRAINDWAERNNKFKRRQPRFEGRDITPYLVAALSVFLPDPQFGGQTKGKLNNPEAQKAVHQVAYSYLQSALDKQPRIASAIFERCLHAQKLRLAQTKLLEKQAGGWGEAKRSGKLSDCLPATPPEERELYLLEGESAGGTAKEARDIRTQAILPLRGKILNLQRASKAELAKSEIIQEILHAIGARMVQDGRDIVVSLPPEGPRVGKIIILCDADSDGAHIACLLLGALWQMVPALMREGRVYLARPPLYRLIVGKDDVLYAYNDEELQKLLQRYQGKQVAVTRYKGLGEMAADELAETAMRKETRRVDRVLIEDPEEFAEAIDLVLGPSSERRRQWLFERAPTEQD